MDFIFVLAFYLIFDSTSCIHIYVLAECVAASLQLVTYTSDILKIYDTEFKKKVIKKAT